MRKASKKAVERLARLQECRAARHGHHGIYVAYYVLGAFEHHGVSFAIVCVIATLHIIATLTGED